MKLYEYPDGAKSHLRPRDGDYFHTLDPISGDDIEWQWDNFKEQWFDVTKKKNSPYKEMYPDRHKVEISYHPTCECGSEKTGSNKHSNWCAKYTN